MKEDLLFQNILNSTMSRFLMISVIGILTTHYLSGQISFRSSEEDLIKADIYSGIPVAVSDMNGDLLDDIVRLDKKKFLHIDYQNPDGSFHQSYYGEVLGESWSICISDVNNDGFNDIATAGFYDKIKIIKYDSNLDYYLNDVVNDLIFIQASNFIDIDNDGWVDYFACHDDGHSRPFRNNEGLEFNYDLSLINTSSGDEYNDSGNYGSIWTDYDDDGDMDMYLSKCRIGVDDIYDPRRVNKMYRNNGDGSFSDVAEEIGLLPLTQSWVTDFADIDNDGDLDCMIINHDIRSMIFINIGNGRFKEITTAAIDTNELMQTDQIIQLKFADLDNDGYVDFLISGVEGRHQVYHNNGDLSFSRIMNAIPSESEDIRSFTTGDLNNDGFVDVMATFPENYNSIGVIPDRLFLNNGNDNNFIKINLKGTVSNQNAIGSKISLYLGNAIQTREIRSGESYGVMHSMCSNFGIGQQTKIDSVVVRWPKNQMSVIYDPEINSSLTLVEPFGCSDKLEVRTQTICSLDSIFLQGAYQNTDGVYIDSFMISGGCDSIIETTLLTYNENSFTRFLSTCKGINLVLNGQMITESGEYRDTLIDEYGCDSIMINQVTFLETYLDSIEYGLCPGDSINIDDVFYRSGDRLLEMNSTLNGCDSLTYIEFIDLIIPRDTIELYLCPNDSILINGNYIYDTAVILDTVAFNDCFKEELSFVYLEELLVDFEVVQNQLFSIINDSFQHQWLICEEDSLSLIGGATGTSYDVESSGSYALQITDINTGCNYYSTCENIILSEVDDDQNDSDISITPNPSTGTFNIKCNSSKSLKLKLIAPSGDLIYMARLNELNKQLNLQDFSKGVYYLLIDDGSSISTKKIVVY